MAGARRAEEERGQEEGRSARGTRGRGWWQTGQRGRFSAAAVQTLWSGLRQDPGSLWSPPPPSLKITTPSTQPSRLLPAGKGAGEAGATCRAAGGLPGPVCRPL